MKYREVKNISFPLGGIGTGCIGLAGNGELNDWEIFNRPNKNTRNGYSHFAIKAVSQEKTIVKILQGDTTESLIGMRDPAYPGGFDFGPRVNSMAGYPHFKGVEFDGMFPIANLSFEDEEFPAKVRLCAFNPFIPHDDFNSSLPVACFEWEIENISNKDVRYSIAFNVQNPSSHSKNREVENGIFLFPEDKTKEEIGYCDLSVLTDNEDVVVQEYWYRGVWQDSVTTYWENFSQTESMPKRFYENGGAYDHASVVATIQLQAGERKKIRFVLAWNTPVQYNYWSPFRDDNGKDVTWKNYYATQFKDSMETAKYTLSNFEKLLDKTRLFTETLQNSAMPNFVVEAISANLAVLKSPTVMRLEDGSFWGFEGVHDRIGLCEGACQHVWGYAYALPFLFPKLERSMRENFVKYGLDEYGQVSCRLSLPIGQRERICACVDGQMGEVIKFYREWKISGDNEWMKKHANAVFDMLEFAWSKNNQNKWDENGDGVLEGVQFHTLDMELFGENSWLQGFYLLALDCASKIASFLGDKQRSKKYRCLYERGKAWTNENLFNGEYFGQKIDLKDKALLEKYSMTDKYWNEETGEIKYQIGDGCIIDQMLADWHAAIIGIEGVFDCKKKEKALKSLYKYNFKPSMRSVTNTFRNFAVNDEAGTVICSFPDGRIKPLHPILYHSETMTGFEYALGGLMLSEGFMVEGETIIKAVRDRYNGGKRNPWSEIECGHHYARSMASFALLPIYSGFSFDMTENYIGFKPIYNQEGSYLWSIANAYGEICFFAGKTRLSVFDNEIVLRSFGLRTEKKVLNVSVDGKEILFMQKGDRIYFEKQTIKNILEIQVEN